MNFQELLDDFCTLTYAISRYNTITERNGVKAYEEIALSENYYEALISLSKKYNIECNIGTAEKLEAILIMEKDIEYGLKNLILGSV